jgi:hypothetical protein
LEDGENNLPTAAIARSLSLFSFQRETKQQPPQHKAVMTQERVSLALARAKIIAEMIMMAADRACLPGVSATFSQRICLRVFPPSSSRRVFS